MTRTDRNQARGFLSCLLLIAAAVGLGATVSRGGSLGSAQGGGGSSQGGGGGGASGWNTSLGVNATTGGHNPLVTTGDGISFGTGSTPRPNAIVWGNGLSVSGAGSIVGPPDDDWTVRMPAVSPGGGNAINLFAGGGDGGDPTTGGGALLLTGSDANGGGNAGLRGGAAAGANHNGGSTVIGRTSSTGTGTSTVEVWTVPAGAAGSGTNAALLRLVVSSAGIVQFGGTTAGFPALKRSGGSLLVRLADDSANAVLAAGSTTVDNCRSLADYQLADSGTIYWSTRSAITSPSSGYITITNNTSNDFGLLQFGGRSASYPAIKRSTTTLAFRLADDSADAGFSGGTFTTSSGAFVSPAAGGFTYFQGDGATAQRASMGTLFVGTTFSHTPPTGGILTDAGYGFHSAGVDTTSKALFAYQGSAGVVGLLNPAALTTSAALRVYNTTDAANLAPTNAEWLEVKWASNVCTIQANVSGTGTQRDLRIYNPAGAGFTVGANNNLTINTNGGLLSVAGNVYFQSGALFKQYNNISTVGQGVPPVYGLDFRQGVTTADGAATTLYTTTNGTSVFRITADIFATAVTSGTATYTVTWTQNSTTQTMVVSSTVINTLGTATDLINPDNGTNITAKLTGTFSQTVTVTAAVEQIK